MITIVGRETKQLLMRMEKDPLGYYHVLDLAPDSNADAIRAAFRRAAMRFHPDQGGSLADKQSFQKVREAYDILKDPAKRLAYDADNLNGLANGHEQPRYAPREKNGSKFNLGFVVVCLLLAIAVGALALLNQKLSTREAMIVDLSTRIERASAERAAMATKLRAQNFQSLDQALANERGNFSVYQTDIQFSAGMIVLDAGAQDRLTADLLALSEMINQIPKGRDWTVLIESSMPKAASDDGVFVRPWEVGILRLANIVEHMVAVGLPGDRVAARFQAGFSPSQDDAGERDKLELKLLCCLRAN